MRKSKELASTYIGGQRPLKVRFWAQTTAKELLARSYRLSKKEEYKNV